MKLFYTNRTKEVANKIGWMGLKWEKIESTNRLEGMKMEYLKEALLVKTEAEKDRLTKMNSDNSIQYWIVVSEEEIMKEKFGEVVGLPAPLRGCSPEQLFDGSYRVYGI